MRLKTEHMKYINKAIILAMVLITSHNIIAQKRTKIDGVAAVVGDKIVLYSEVTAVKKQLEQDNESKKSISKCSIIEKIMNDKLLAHHAVIDSIEVDDANINSEVDRRIDYFTKQLGSKEKVLEFYGFDKLSDIKKELFNIEKEGVLIRRMQQQITTGTDVTPQEVSSYFKSLQDVNSVPEFGAEVELAQIVIEAKPNEGESQSIIDKLNKMKADIEAGSSFKMKAILYSQDPAASRKGQGEGGEYTITKQTGFVKEFKEVAFSLEENEISEPFKTQFGYHIIKVNKIKGKERNISHILLQTNITEKALEVVNDTLTSLRNRLLRNEITFEDAVLKYSTDKNTNKNKGLLINPRTNDTHFNLTNIDPSLYARISELKEGELSDVLYEETREGEKMYKIIKIISKTPSHLANLEEDYVKIKNLALQKKRKELVEKWTKDKINDTYIKIHNQFKSCTFEYNWLKN